MGDGIRYMGLLAIVPEERERLKQPPNTDNVTQSLRLEAQKQRA